MLQEKGQVVPFGLCLGPLHPGEIHSNTNIVLYALQTIAM